MMDILEPGEGLQDKVMRKHLLSLGLMRDGLIDTQPPQFSSPSIHQRALRTVTYKDVRMAELYIFVQL